MSTAMSAAAHRPNETREKILDAAERLIVEHGYAATSLRAIASAACVNLAATHYHFGSKLGLFSAVFHRRMQPISNARLAALDAIEKGSEPISVETIVRAFLAPLFDAESDDLLETLPSLIGRIYGEPESLTKPMLEQEFNEVASRFQSALSTALPDVTREDINWRFHLMIGAMIQLLRFHAPLGIKPSKQQFFSGLEHLVAFTTAGLTQPRAPGSNP